MVNPEQLRDRIKRDLLAYVDRDRERQQLEEQLARLEATATAPKSQSLDGMPRGSGGGDVMVNIVAELIRLQDRYQANLAQLIAAQNRVENLIDRLDPLERSLMRSRYIKGQTWEEVCVELNYSWRQVHRIHGRILDQLVQIELSQLGAEEQEEKTA